MMPVSHTRPDDPMEHFVGWCRDTVLPFWARHGVDRKHGGFYEQLHFDGRPDVRANRRVRVSARQIYAFSHASVLGWLDARELVGWGVDYLVSKTYRPDGEPGFVHLLDGEGAVCDARRDLYDHAFHILGLSWAYQATQDSQILKLARDTLAYTDEAMSAKEGGWHEGSEAIMPRRQNPHMHMFEALLALYEASEDAHYLCRAEEVLHLLETRFVDPKTGMLMENFDGALCPIHPIRLEPGHMAEWCWLLHRYAMLSGQKMHRLANLLGQNADQFASKGDGLLLEAFAGNGDIIKPSHRLWAQIEWLKSMLARFGAGEGGMMENASALLGKVREPYLEVETPGLWMDQFDREGTPMATYVPASIVYHLVSAAAEAQSALKISKGQQV